MHFLTLFLDGVGLGQPDPSYNPFARVQTPNLCRVLGPHRLVIEPDHKDKVIHQSKYATLLKLDATLGIEGLPQSASAQASILTGINIPDKIGYHYGPKPDPRIISYLKSNTIFHHLRQADFSVGLINAYPQLYFDQINAGRRLPGDVAMSVINAGIPLKNTEDLKAGQALSADLTGQAWKERLNIPKIPILSLYQAGVQLKNVALNYDFSFFEFWLFDYIGHKKNMSLAVEWIEAFDKMLGGLLSTWNLDEDLILIISDHGNLEDLRTRRHTRNPVPGLVIGPRTLRDSFCHHLVNLTGIAPSILQFFQND